MEPRILGIGDVVAAVIAPVAFVFLVSLLREPTRQRYMAIFVAGAGSAYLGGGLGVWEVAFAAVASWLAYRGLESYPYIGAAWLAHTAWDVVHHFYGNEILPFVPNSSAGCAITDALLALWFFARAPSPYEMLGRRGVATATR